ncbi:MAG: helix-turn-helix domain-containing protein [Alphaproteobacteria bacterium]|nr:helix-turn-helix domain-containing protein [Alphaproteobacteria bacterium]
MSIDQHIRACVRDEIRRTLPKLLSGDGGGFLTTAQVSDLTGLSVPFFEIGRTKGHLDQPTHFKIGRNVRYRREDVLAWLEKRRGGAQ